MIKIYTERNIDYIQSMFGMLNMWQFFSLSLHLNKIAERVVVAVVFSLLVKKKLSHSMLIASESLLSMGFILYANYSFMNYTITVGKNSQRKFPCHAIIKLHFCWKIHAKLSCHMTSQRDFSSHSKTDSIAKFFFLLLTMYFICA